MLVLVRTASTRRFDRVHTINVLSINIKNIEIFQYIFLLLSAKILCILHGRVFVMGLSCNSASEPE